METAKKMREKLNSIKTITLKAIEMAIKEELQQNIYTMKSNVSLTLRAVTTALNLVIWKVKMVKKIRTECASVVRTKRITTSTRIPPTSN